MECIDRQSNAPIIKYILIAIVRRGACGFSNISSYEQSYFSLLQSDKKQFNYNLTIQRMNDQRTADYSTPCQFGHGAHSDVEKGSWLEYIIMQTEWLDVGRASCLSRRRAQRRAPGNYQNNPSFFLKGESHARLEMQQVWKYCGPHNSTAGDLSVVQGKM
jgi:hypothetical protein